MTNTPKLVGIGGKLRSGKDTVSDYLVENHGWVKIGMSDALWEALLVLDPAIPIEVGEGDDLLSLTVRLSDIYDSYLNESKLSKDEAYVKIKQLPEVRSLLQRLGTEVGRNMIDEDVWVQIAAKRAVGLLDEGKSVILTGIRFPNELDMVGMLGGKLWWVNRPNLSAETSLGAHASENGVKGEDFDLTIENDGTLDQLYNQVEGLLGND